VSQTTCDEKKKYSLESSADVGATLSGSIKILQRDGARGDARLLVRLGVSCGERYFDGRVANSMSGECIREQLVDEFVPVWRARAGNLGDGTIGLLGSIAISKL